MIRLFLAALLIAAAHPAAARVLKIATWNLEWLTLRAAGDPILPPDVVPKGPADRALLRRYANTLDADVVAFQEVDGPQVAAEIFTPDRYALFFTHDDVVQRVGFAVRRGITVQQNPDLVALDVNPNAHFHLRSGADITLTLPGARLRLLGVHLKSGCHYGSLVSSAGRVCETLRRQMAPMQGWITQRRSEGVPFALLGDFNRRMDGRDDMIAALDEAAPLLRVTEGRSTPCWGGNSFIDHILLGGAARAWLEPNSLRVIVYREGEEAKERLSDHCPVSVRLDLPG
ncbi:MAG: endonuclease/exonuclease/phosphatase family protein [Acetobacteraceae bacterium]|nr:endonuclease/exonuclease/phosphatase family protein [Acetobacteraceae bacterium]